MINLIVKFGNLVPAESELNAESPYPVSNAAVTKKISELSERIDDFAGNEITAADVDALFSGYSYAVGIGIGNFDEL